MATDVRFGVGAMVTGVGATIVFGVLAFIWENPPGWVLIVLAAVGVALFLVGLLVVVQALFFHKEDAMSTKKPEDDRNIDVRSYNQQGGITAGVVNIQGEIQPEISLSNESYSETEDGHVYEADLNIKTQFVIPSLKVSAFAKSIKDFDVVPQRGGLHMTGHAGKRDDHHFTTLQNAAGLYRVKVVTSKAEQVQVDFGS